MKHFEDIDPLKEKDTDPKQEESGIDETKERPSGSESEPPGLAISTPKPVVKRSRKPKSPKPKPVKPESSEPAPAEPESAQPEPLLAEKPEIQTLIDDDEERSINDSYNDALDHEELHEEPRVESEQVQAAEDESLHYSLLVREDLVKLLREKLDHPGKENFRKEVDGIRKAFYEKQQALQEEKKQHFLEEGGLLEDFKPAEDPLEAEMRDLLAKYRGLKAEHTRQVERTKQENLVRKQDVLDQFRMLMEGQESFESTFRKFKDLQRQWFSAGIIPQQNLKDLWDSYNYFVDKFNDYVRINRELRTLDLKKNLELKIQLIERTEELDKEPNVIQAFKTLQKYHSRWREIGPVPRENRDEVWERFKQATSAINHKHQDYHTRLKASLQENLEKKAALCQKLEEIAAKKYESHGAWIEKTHQVLEIQKMWKTIGYAPKKDNNTVYSRFRDACDTFFGNKAAFYSAAYSEQRDNLKLKYEIVERAEALSGSQEWKETTNELIRLQKQWKEIGPVPRKESDKLWRRFRTACDLFFSNKSKHFDNAESSFEENLKAKEAIIREMEEFMPTENMKQNREALEDFQTRFDRIGFVPASKKEWIRDQFRKSQEAVLERTGMDESERSIFLFRNRIKGMLQSQRSEMKLNFERDKLISKLQQLRTDIGVWENNVGFFKQSHSSEETIHGYHEKIEAARQRIKVLERKIRILDDMENEN
jgi:hypothetical protein